jgi:tetratricopeptide (TPR) repeat protein
MSDVINDLLRQAFQARKENRLKDAKTALDRAVQLCREDASSVELAAALTRLGQIERDLNSNDAALKHYIEAVGILRSEGDELRLAHAIRHLGDIYQEIGHAELAEPCYEESLHIYRANEATHPLDLANAIRGLAILKDKGGDVEYAKALWSEAKNLYEAVRVKEGVAESSRRLARLAG